MKNSVASIIQAGVDINASSRVHNLAWEMAIDVAIRSGNKAIIKLLVKAEADVNVGRGLLGLTFYENATEEMQEYIASIHPNPSSIKGLRTETLIKAVKSEDEELVASIIQAGVDINASSRVHNLAWEMAIGVAIRSGNKAIIKLLVKAGADVNVGRRGLLGPTFYENATEEMQEYIASIHPNPSSIKGLRK